MKYLSFLFIALIIICQGCATVIQVPQAQSFDKHFEQLPLLFKQCKTHQEAYTTFFSFQLALNVEFEHRLYQTSALNVRGVQFLLKEKKFYLDDVTELYKSRIAELEADLKNAEEIKEFMNEIQPFIIE